MSRPYSSGWCRNENTEPFHMFMSVLNYRSSQQSTCQSRSRSPWSPATSKHSGRSDLVLGSGVSVGGSQVNDSIPLHLRDHPIQKVLSTMSCLVSLQPLFRHICHIKFALHDAQRHKGCAPNKIKACDL